jgi:gas vesicle protein
MVDKGSAEGFGTGFLVGTIVGATIGVLYAPHSGRVTSGLIDEKIHDATRRAEKIVDEARDKAAGILKEARETVKK